MGRPNVTVRWAEVKDARAIAGVHVASWRAAYPGLLPDEILAGLSVEAREREWREWLAEGGERQHTLVAERGGAPIAFCTLRLPSADEGEREDVGEIPALYVDPRHFATGAGTVLIEAGLEAMRERGHREAILWMLDGNERAAAFYERRGWHRDGGRRPSRYYPGLVGPTEVRWRRTLSGDGSAAAS
jgi:GNAT superfamily N-acetyltransferase